jgi:hypothetical protein
MSERFPGEKTRHPTTEEEWAQPPVLDAAALDGLRAMWSRHWPECADGDSCGFAGEARVGLALLDALAASSRREAEARSEQERDLADMRRFQASYIAADHARIAAERERDEARAEGFAVMEHWKTAALERDEALARESDLRAALRDCEWALTPLAPSFSGPVRDEVERALAAARRALAASSPSPGGDNEESKEGN